MNLITRINGILKIHMPMPPIKQRNNISLTGGIRDKMITIITAIQLNRIFIPPTLSTVVLDPPGTTA